MSYCSHISRRRKSNNSKKNYRRTKGGRVSSVKTKPVIVLPKQVPKQVPKHQMSSNVKKWYSSMHSPYRLRCKKYTLEMKYDPKGPFACFNTDCRILPSKSLGGHEMNEHIKGNTVVNVKYRAQHWRRKCLGGVEDNDVIENIMQVIMKIGGFSASSSVFSTLYTHLTNTLTSDKISQIENGEIGFLEGTIWTLRDPASVENIKSHIKRQFMCDDLNDDQRQIILNFLFADKYNTKERKDLSANLLDILTKICYLPKTPLWWSSDAERMKFMLETDETIKNKYSCDMDTKLFTAVCKMPITLLHVDKQLMFWKNYSRLFCLAATRKLYSEDDGIKIPYFSAVTSDLNLDFNTNISEQITPYENQNGKLDFFQKLEYPLCNSYYKKKYKKQRPIEVDVLVPTEQTSSFSQTELDKIENRIKQDIKEMVANSRSSSRQKSEKKI